MGKLDLSGLPWKEHTFSFLEPVQDTFFFFLFVTGSIPKTMTELVYIE